MNEHEAAQFVDTLVDTVPDTPAPMHELLAQGKSAQSRMKVRRATVASAAVVAVIALAGTTLTLGGSDEPDPAPATTGPDVVGAAQVVEQWLITIQTEGLKAACPLMTTSFQRAMPAFNCDNPNVSDSPPFMTIDYRDAEIEVASQGGDIATVQVTHPGRPGQQTAYTTVYDHDQGEWLIDGFTIADNPAPGTVAHLPTFVPPDGFAREESTEVGPLTLDNETGCLTWNGDPVAFPTGTVLADDGSIRFPNGRVLRWWEDASFWQSTTRGPLNEDFHDGVESCLPAGSGPYTIVNVTGVSDSSAIPGSSVILLTGGSVHQARVRGALTMVGNCAGINEAVAIWPEGTTVLRESPLELNVPGLGRIHEGEQVDGGGGYFDTDTDDIGIVIPASCDTTEAVTFRPE